MYDKAPEPAQASEHERALVEAALREVASTPRAQGPSAGHPPSIRAYRRLAELMGAPANYLTRGA